MIAGNPLLAGSGAGAVRAGHRARLFAGLIIGMLFLLRPGKAAADTVVTDATQAALQAALNGGGLVRLSFDGTVTLTNPLTVTDASTIIDASGRTITLSGNNAVRLLSVPTGKACAITNVTFLAGKFAGGNGANGTKGADSQYGSGGSGGNGVAGTNGAGGAILNRGNLVLANCQLLTNTAAGGDGGNGGNGGSGYVEGGDGGNGGNGGTAYGGAVYNEGTLLLTNCTVAGNSAIGGNGGSGGTNGAGGYSGPGTGGAGAIGGGGGVCNASSGNVTIVNCLFSSNQTQGGSGRDGGSKPGDTGKGINGPAGGAAYGPGFINLGTATVINTTFFANASQGGNGGNGGPGTVTAGNGGNGGSGLGGGIFNSAGTIGVMNCTFQNNSARGGTNGLSGGLYASDGIMGQGAGGNIANNGTATLLLKNSILNGGTNGSNAFGTINDQGYNLSSDATPNLTSPSRKNINPKLDSAPANNGGPTLTIALLSGSPAIDHGSDPALPFDQRGLPRDPTPDIGAFEAQTPGIAGTVSALGTGISGITVVLTGPGGSRTNVTQAGGIYSFFNLAASNTTYTVSVFPANLFTDPVRTVVLGATNVTALNFLANAQGNQLIPGFSGGAVMYTSLPAGDGGSILIDFNTLSNHTYKVQASTNLVDWVDLYYTTNSGSSGVFSFTNSFNPTSYPVRFFRSVLVQ